MTIKQAASSLRLVGIVVRKCAESQEFRVNFHGGCEATAYYTNCLEDAHLTGMRMAVEGNRHLTSMCADCA